MPGWPVGLSTGCFYHQNILSCLDTIKHGGFDLIEVCSVLTHLDYYDVIAVRRANDRIRELELTAHSFHAPFAQHIDISSPSDSVRKNAVAEVLMAAEAGKAVSTTTISEDGFTLRIREKCMKNYVISVMLWLGFCSESMFAAQVVRIGHFPNVTHAQALVAHQMSRSGDGWFVRAELTAEMKHDLSPQVIERSWRRLRFASEISRAPFEAFLTDAQTAGFLRNRVDLSRLVETP